jgi:uncharacterized protein (DUF305 family)
MQKLSMVFAVLALAFVGTVAQAQSTTNATEQPTCPPATSMGLSVPALIGAGPAPELTNLTGAEFDRAYIQKMYQFNTNMAALATLGIEQTTDKNLKDLSGKIRYEKTKQNEVYAMTYRDMGLGKIPVDYSKVQTIVDSLMNYTGTDFDVQYARVMTGLLTQARDAAQLAMSRATNPRLRDQANIEARAAQNEINALQRWIGQETTFATPTPVAPTGAVTSESKPTKAPCP